MFEVKRKPNRPGSQETASTTARAFADSTASRLYDEPSTVHAVAQLKPSTLPQRTGHSFVTPPVSDTQNFKTKLPIITGEAQYKGILHLDGIATGQLAGGGGSLSVRQKSGSFSNEPEFSGEIWFRDMVRVNGHIAGTVYSNKGTLIVDVNATVDANVDVAIAVIGGTVKGDIVARERVEIGPSARIYGSIRTRSLQIRNGAIFEGTCTMIAQQQIAG